MFEEALSMSLRSSGVSSTSAAPRFSSRRCSLVVPGIGAIHGFFAKQPSERDLSRCCLLLFRESTEQINQRLVGFTILWVKARDGVAEIGAIELRLFVNLSRE